MAQGNRRAWLFLLPATVWVILVGLGPTVYMIGQSFFAPRYDEALGRSVHVWVGLDNYRRFFEEEQLVHGVWFTLGVAVVSVALEVVLGLAVALLAWRAVGGTSRFWRGIFAMPMLMAPVAVAYLATTVFAQEVGLINGTLHRLFGVPIESLPRWRSDKFWAPVAIVLVEVWQWTPFCFIVLLAGLVAQPDDLREAAVVDGASEWQVFWHVTLPMLSPVLLTVTLLRLIEALKLFDVPYGLTRGGPGTWTQTYSMWIKEAAFTRYDMGLASAMGTMLLFTLLALAMVLLPLLRRQLAVEQE